MFFKSKKFIALSTAIVASLAVSVFFILRSQDKQRIIQTELIPILKELHHQKWTKSAISNIADVTLTDHLFDKNNHDDYSRLKSISSYEGVMAHSENNGEFRLRALVMLEKEEPSVVSVRFAKAHGQWLLAELSLAEAYLDL